MQNFKLEVKYCMFHNFQCKYRAVIDLKWFSTESCKIYYAKIFENHTTFVEGFWPEFNAWGKFTKYSMSGPNPD